MFHSPFLPPERGYLKSLSLKVFAFLVGALAVEYSSVVNWTGSGFFGRDGASTSVLLLLLLTAGSRAVGVAWRRVQQWRGEGSERTAAG